MNREEAHLPNRPRNLALLPLGFQLRPTGRAEQAFPRCPQDQQTAIHWPTGHVLRWWLLLLLSRRRRSPQAQGLQIHHHYGPVPVLFGCSDVLAGSPLHHHTQQTSLFRWFPRLHIGHCLRSLHPWDFGELVRSRYWQPGHCFATSAVLSILERCRVLCWPAHCVQGLLHRREQQQFDQRSVRLSGRVLRGSCGRCTLLLRQAPRSRGTGRTTWKHHHRRNSGSGAYFNFHCIANCTDQFAGCWSVWQHYRRRTPTQAVQHDLRRHRPVLLRWLPGHHCQLLHQLRNLECRLQQCDGISNVLVRFDHFHSWPFHRNRLGDSFWVELPPHHLRLWCHRVHSLRLGRPRNERSRCPHSRLLLHGSDVPDHLHSGHSKPWPPHSTWCWYPGHGRLRWRRFPTNPRSHCR